jgi:hypothetical protein
MTQRAHVMRIGCRGESTLWILSIILYCQDGELDEGG